MRKEGRTTMLTRAWRTLAILGAALLVADGSAAWACPVCFGAADSPMTQGMNMAIALMLGILACVATGFVFYIVWQTRHASAYGSTEPTECP